MKQRTKQTSGNTANGKHSTLKRVCVLFAFFALLGAVAMVSAKYVQTKDNTATAAAVNAYFTSDLLDGTTHTISPNSDGTASVTFRLQNHADELRYSEADLTYTVTVDNGATVSPDGGTIQAGKNHDADITLSGLKAGQSYTVTATTSEPYVMKLTGTIQVSAVNSGITVSTEDKTQYVLVTVSTADYSGNVTLNYPAGLIPDNTDSMMASWTTGKAAQTFKMDANSAHIFRFFKDTGYSGNGSEVTANAAK